MQASKQHPLISLLDYEYSLPKQLIAQTPIEPRDSSRLMILNDDNIEHKTFEDLLLYLKRGDVLVLNNTKVSAFKLDGKKDSGGNVELLVLSRTGPFATCLIKGKNIREGTEIIFNNGIIKAIVLDKLIDGKYYVEFTYCEKERIRNDNNDLFEKTLKSISNTPVPPYIKEKSIDIDRYQTIYANTPGSAAAPTAGLHFTNNMFDAIKNMGVNIVYVTLHIGTGTFFHVNEATLKRGKLENEYFKIDDITAKQINSAIEGNGRLFIAGTSTLRALESSMKNGKVIPQISSTELFIYPGYAFKLRFHGLLTNFHLPRSTLFMLVCAYAGRERILKAYNEAIEHKYRFYSFGDAMLICSNK